MMKQGTKVADRCAAIGRACCLTHNLANGTALATDARKAWLAVDLSETQQHGGPMAAVLWLACFEWVRVSTGGKLSAQHRKTWLAELALIINLAWKQCPFSKDDDGGGDHGAASVHPAPLDFKSRAAGDHLEMRGI